MPRHTRQNRPEVKRPTECNPRTGEERPHTNALERPRGPLTAGGGLNPEMNILPVLIATGRVHYSPQVGQHNTMKFDMPLNKGTKLNQT